MKMLFENWNKYLNEGEVYTAESENYQVYITVDYNKRPIIEWEIFAREEVDTSYDYEYDYDDESKTESKSVASGKENELNPSKWGLDEIYMKAHDENNENLWKAIAKAVDDFKEKELY